MKALVTGGAGFIGSTLVDRLLSEGHEVDVVDDLSTGTLVNLSEARESQQGRLRFHQMDICAEELVELAARRQPEVVFHLAAQADVRVSVRRPLFDATVNVLGTIRVLESARAAGAGRVVFAASGGTLYGEVELSECPINESHPHRPLSPYGASKAAVLSYFYAYEALYGIDYVALALGNVYGPRQDPHGEAGVIAIFASHLLDGQQCTIYGDGEQTRDFVYVDDVVDAFVRAGTGNPLEDPEIPVNIGRGVNVSVNQLHAEMCKVLGLSATPRYAPARPGELRHNSLDPRRAWEVLGWAPWTELPEGLYATIEAVDQRKRSSS